MNHRQMSLDKWITTKDRNTHSLRFVLTKMAKRCSMSLYPAHVRSKSYTISISHRNDYADLGHSPRRPDGRLVAEATLHLPPSVPSFMPALPLPALASSLSDRPRTSASTGSAPGLASKSSSRNRALSGLNHEEDETVDARLVTIQRRMQALHAETQRLLDETQTL